MEYDWERTFPFLEIDKTIVSKLFKGILKESNIANVIPINQGCRTTNYIIETDGNKDKYLLKIFFSMEQNYMREIKLLTMLKEDKALMVPKIYKISNYELIGNRQYAIYEYMDGKTIGMAINAGYELDEYFVRNVARSLAKIHSYKFNKVGFLDEKLHVPEELPPLVFWYENLMGNMAKRRLGESIVNKINLIVKQNKEVLDELDKDIRLVHGDFQVTNILVKDGNLSGILDWEFAMAGHPIADIGQFFRYKEYFNKNLLEAFEDEYNKNSDYKLSGNWYKISKLRDLINLIQLIDTKDDMPKKHEHIKSMVVDTIDGFDIN
ncbi:aminoglycoside phosphotransferase family protein [Clostridium sp.]|uniref:aminoglycoside phosphotransferase family protein n=1 Tax=Clostridium sp. TaxID=1506 RepID=UPI0028494AE1|nr:aminoglycoside phosphotransferase family protein [Clostridium sp.]MDR3594945.1 aminoglycoside phosphotransferase family protein [Clostridium sp.]